MNELRRIFKRAAMQLPQIRRLFDARDVAVLARDDAFSQRDTARAERDTALNERDTARAERDTALKERDTAGAERETALHERDTARNERDAVVVHLDQVTVHAKLSQNLCDGDPEANPNIIDGRNLRAGYVRGHGLESLEIVPAIQRDPDYKAALEASHGRSIVLDHSLMNLFLIIKYSDLSGNIVEFGSYNGGSALFMACLAKRLRPGCKVFALDTFTGMPESDPKLDFHRSGDFADTTLDELIRLRDAAGLDNLIFVKGLFQDTVRQIDPSDRRFFLSHIDCDIYTSVLFSTDWAKQHAVPGSYIVFDDPLYSTCLGAMKVVEQELIQKEGVLAEQAYPHLVYRFPPIGA